MTVDPISAVAAQSLGPSASGTRTFDLLPPGMSDRVTIAQPQAEARFSQAMARVGAGDGAVATGPIPPALKGMFEALDQVNVQARAVSDYAATAEASGGQLTPGEMIQLTMKCQEFMFQAQLTSNIANRSSDGIQQLFKQQ